MVQLSYTPVYPVSGSCINIYTWRRFSLALYSCISRLRIFYLYLYLEKVQFSSILLYIPSQDLVFIPIPGEGLVQLYTPVYPIYGSCINTYLEKVQFNSLLLYIPSQDLVFILLPEEKFSLALYSCVSHLRILYQYLYLEKVQFSSMLLYILSKGLVLIPYLQKVQFISVLLYV